MFRHLTSFGYQRTAGQAIGFYLFYLASGILLIWATNYTVGLATSAFGPTSTTNRVSTSRGVSTLSTPNGATTVNLPGLSVESAPDGATNVHMPGLSVETAADGSTNVGMPGMSVKAAADGTTSVSVGGIKTTTAPDGSTTVGPDWGMFGLQRSSQRKTMFGIILTAALALLVLRAKRQLGRVGYLIVTLVSLAGALMGGLLIGLMFVAFLTTQPDAGNVDSLPEQIEADAAA